MCKFVQAEKTSAKMASMKEEMERLRALADDRERLSMTAQSLEDRLKQRETEVRCDATRWVLHVHMHLWTYFYVHTK